jgi:ferredoxin
MVMLDLAWKWDVNLARGGVRVEKTTIFYYTGTGNSLWIARLLAKELGNTELVSMSNARIDWNQFNSSFIGLVFPVHIWGVPRRVLNFLDQLPCRPGNYIFAIANNAGQVSNTLIQLQQEMASRGLELDSGWSVILPSNYIPWGGPGSEKEQSQRFTAARLKIGSIAQVIRSRSKRPVDRGPLWQRIVFTWIYHWSYPYVHEMDKSFWADDRCNQCQLCLEVCPNHNIVMEDNKLVWQNHCEQCLACIQWCPKESMQYGKKTPKYKRYHHPEIKIKDLLN